MNLSECRINSRRARGSPQRHGSLGVSTLIAALLFVVKSTIASPDMDVSENLGPSLAASMSQGTTIAVPWCLHSDEEGQRHGENAAADREPHDGVLILMRTPNQRNHLTTKDIVNANRGSTVKVSDLNIWPHDMLSFSTPVLPQRWRVLGENNVVCMTGFSPEVHYLTRFLQETVDSYRRTLESDGQERTPPVVKLMKDLALQYQVAALSRSSRPFGVAVLMVGRSSDRSRWQVWTLDPSGTLRSGTTGAIGKEAPALIKKLTENETVSGTPREALFRMLRASRETFLDVSTNLEAYEAVLLCWREDGMQVGSVSIDDIQECLTTIANEEDKREREEA